MGKSIFALAMLAAGAVAALAEDVITLTGDTFAQAVKDNEKLVVEFYAPWCASNYCMSACLAMIFLPIMLLMRAKQFS